MKAKKKSFDQALGLSALIVAGGLLVPPAWLEAHVPTLCLWHGLGLRCWTCGLTRSVCSASHGDWAAAWTYHPLGIPFFMLAAAVLVRTLWRLRPSNAVRPK